MFLSRSPAIKTVDCFHTFCAPRGGVIIGSFRRGRRGSNNGGRNFGDGTSSAAESHLTRERVCHQHGLPIDRAALHDRKTESEVKRKRKERTDPFFFFLFVSRPRRPTSRTDAATAQSATGPRRSRNRSRNGRRGGVNKQNETTAAGDRRRTNKRTNAKKNNTYYINKR